jgi:hypothetical protein
MASPQAGAYNAVNASSRGIAGDSEAGEDAAETTTGSIATRRTDLDAGGCRSARTVPAAGGGERKVTVTRC